MILRAAILFVLSFGAFAADKYALVAAMGDQFFAQWEFRGTGSRLPNYGRRSLDVKDEGINKLALASIDGAVRKMHPDVERVYLVVPLSKDSHGRVRDAEAIAFETAVEALRARPDRDQWQRIVLITPTNRIKGEDGLAADTQGMGMFTQGLCQTDVRDCDKRRSTTSGVEVTTPKGEKVTSDRFVAPYFFAKIWVLDPQSLQVLDSEVVMDHAKYNDPASDAMDQNEVLDRKFLLTRIVEQVEASTATAVRRTELRGKVEVQDRGPVAPPK